jgi:putative phosphoesterase
MKQIGILSDTHSYLDDRILKHLEDCDEIWHAGDIGTIDVTDRLNELPGRLRVVYGNIDGGEIRKEFNLNEAFQVESVGVLMTHIAGRPGRYPSRVKELVKELKPNIFVCGHSHICLVQYNKEFNLIHINPGAAGKHGFHKKRTLVKLEINGEKVENLRIVELGNR